MKFTSLENPEDDSRFSNISCSFQVSSQVPYELQKGEALITFEKEEGMTNVQHCDQVTLGKHLHFQRAVLDIWLLLYNLTHIISSHSQSETLRQVWLSPFHRCENWLWDIKWHECDHSLKMQWFWDSSPSVVMSNTSVFLFYRSLPNDNTDVLRT